jgi:transcriptional regulator with XRE-family HTH domain
MPMQGQQSPRWTAADSAAAKSAAAEIFGARLKAARREQGIGQRALAAYLGVSKSSIAKYESGTHTPSVPVLLRLARALNLSLDTLLGTPSGGPPPLHDPRLVRCFRAIAQMEPRTVGYITAVLEALVSAYPMLARVTAEHEERQ